MVQDFASADHIKPGHFAGQLDRPFLPGDVAVSESSRMRRVNGSVDMRPDC